MGHSTLQTLQCCGPDPRTCHLHQSLQRGLQEAALRLSHTAYPRGILTRWRWSFDSPRPLWPFYVRYRGQCGGEDLASQAFRNMHNNKNVINIIPFSNCKSCLFQASKPPDSLHSWKTKPSETDLLYFPPLKKNKKKHLTLLFQGSDAWWVTS